MGKGWKWGWGWSQERHHFPLFMGHPNWDTVVRQSDVTSKAPFPWEVCVCVFAYVHTWCSNSAACPVASSAVSCLSGPDCLGWLALLLPHERISDAARTWRCAHLCSARHKPAGSERWMAGTSRCHPPLLTPLLPAEEEWVRTPPNFTCYTTFVFIAWFFVFFCTTCLPTDSDFYLILWQWHRYCTHNIPATCRGKST